jgi:hypothetical protein
MDERRLGRIRAAPPLSWPPAPSSIFVSLAPVTTSAGLQINRRSSVGVRIRRRSPRPQHLPSWVHRPTPLKAPSTATCFSKKKKKTATFLRAPPGAVLVKRRAKRGKLPFCSFAAAELLQRADLPTAASVKLFWDTFWALAQLPAGEAVPKRTHLEKCVTGHPASSSSSCENQELDLV